MKYNLRTHRHNDISIYYRRIVSRIIMNRRYTYTVVFERGPARKESPPLNIVVNDLRKVYSVITCNDIRKCCTVAKKNMSIGEIKWKSPSPFCRPGQREHDATRRSLEKPSINVLGYTRHENTFYLSMGQTNFTRNIPLISMMIIVIIMSRLPY